MGKYINEIPGVGRLPSLGKAAFIIRYIPGAEEILRPTKFIDNLVCVVDNGFFEAAAWAFDKKEFDRFIRQDDRPRCWLIVPGVDKIAK